MEQHIQQFLDAELSTGWFTVRCIFETNPADRLERGSGIYEERITLWRAAGWDEAFNLAEADARDYAQTVDSVYLGLAQSSKADRPEHGAEVYSLMRDSSLDAEAYLKKFFDTGHERQERTDST